MGQMTQKRWFKYLICGLLVVITGAAFAPVAHHLFIALDDRAYVVGNGHIQNGFTPASLKWAFTSYYQSNWHPLTWLSHMLDCRLFALDPAGPHLVNLAFHVANTVLLFLLLQQLTAKQWPAAFVALLFGIHPMHVESVVWVAERKDLLSGFFFLLTLLAYARYVELAAAKRPTQWLVYLLALLLFALGLMAKPMLVTLPGILCLLDCWPLRRFQLPFSGQSKSLLLRPVTEKIPFVILAVLSCCVTFYVQNRTGAVKIQALLPVAQRFMHVPAAYGWYVLKLFWPANLSVYYLVWSDDFDTVVLGILLLLGVTALALWWVRKRPWFLVGWLWFVGMLVPVIGIVQVGNQAYADRYTYLPYIGLFIILAWGIPELLAKWPLPTRKLILSGGAAVIAAACFWRTEIEVHYWKDGLNLFNRAIAVDPKDEFLWMMLGLEYEDRGNYDKDIECLTQATVLNDNFYLAWQNLGRMRELKSDDAGSIDAYQKAAQRTYFKGDKIKIYNSLGDVLAKTGQYDQAIVSYQNSLELSSSQADVQYKLAQCFTYNGQPDSAIDVYENLLRSHPDNRETQLNLAMLLGSSGRDAEAIPHYQKVIELDTNVVIALNNLAWMLATDSDPHLRNGKEAVALAEHACERTHYQEAFLIGTLAAAYAEAGRYDDAVAAAQKAHDVALAHGQKGIADKNAGLLQLYKSGQPLHMQATPPPKPSL